MQCGGQGVSVWWVPFVPEEGCGSACQVQKMPFKGDLKVPLSQVCCEVVPSSPSAAWSRLGLGAGRAEPLETAGPAR